MYSVTDIKEKCMVSRKTVYYWIRNRKFPVLKVGNSFRIPRATFDSWYMEKTGDTL